MSTIILPVIINQNNPVCPNCGKPEKTKVICQHCEYAYIESEDKLWPYAWIFLIGAISGAVYFTLDMSHVGLIDYMFGAMLGSLILPVLCAVAFGIGYLFYKTFRSIFRRLK